MKALRFTLCLLLCGGLISCSSVTVKSDFDANANFAQHKTFDFMPHHTMPGGNPLIDKRIEKELVWCGWAKGEVNDSVSKEKIDKAIAKILEKYPPQ